jgi:predicted RNase H-like HicB family nuclease
MAKTKSVKVQKNSTTDKVTKFLRQPYTRILTPDAESGTYTAQVLEFPGCVAQGDTPEEAYENLEKSAAGWIEAARDLGQEIPEPFMNQGFGGKIALRLPRSIHRRAALMAEQDNTSLNQFLLSAISERVGAEDLYTRILERLHQEWAQTTLNVVWYNPVKYTLTNFDPDCVMNMPILPAQMLPTSQQPPEGERQNV